MEIKLRNIVSEPVAGVFREVSVEIENFLNQMLSEKRYGADIEQCVIMVVAVESDAAANEKFGKPYDKFGSYKHYISGAQVKFIGYAVPFNPEIIQTLSKADVRKKLTAAILAKINNTDLRIPKAFDYEQFSFDMGVALTGIK